MVNICRRCLGNVGNVSSDDKKRLLVMQDQTNSEMKKTFRVFIVNMLYNENDNLNKVKIFYLV